MLEVGRSKEAVALSIYERRVQPSPMGGTVEKIFSGGKRGKKKRAKKQKFRLGEGMEKLFTVKAKRTSKALPTRGSTWLQKPPKYGSQKAGGKRRRKRR